MKVALCLKSRAASLFAAVVAAILTLASCSVHEWPDEDTLARLKLNFSFATDLPPYLDIRYDTRAGISPDGYDVRYTVKFYPQLPGGDYAGNESIAYTTVLTKDDVTELNYSAVVPLPEGRWRIRCWVDYVTHGSTADLFYDTGDFGAIRIPEGYAADNDFKDAFLGCVDVDLYRVGSREEPVEATLEMERPLTKFQFIATDLEKLVMKVLKEKMALEDGTDRPSESAAAGFNPEDYYIRFYYTSFLPCVFNMFTDKPTDSRMGDQFESEFIPLSEDEVLMGFDYVLVNGTESSVQVQVALYDRETCELLSLTPSITVPLVRSKVTTVRGDFLTLGTGGGIGIDAEFDDEYNVFL